MLSESYLPQRHWCLSTVPDIRTYVILTFRGTDNIEMEDNVCYLGLGDQSSSTVGLKYLVTGKVQVISTSI